MYDLSTGPGMKPVVLVIGRDENNALSFAEPSGTDIAESQLPDLVYSFFPKHLHPPEILNVIACVWAAGVSMPANQDKRVVSVPITLGVAFDCAAAAPDNAVATC